MDVRRLAGFLLMHRRAGDSLTVTMLVNDAFIRLAKAGGSTVPASTSSQRKTFFALMRLSMRSTISDWIRRRKSRTRATATMQASLSTSSISGEGPLLTTLSHAQALADALDRLATLNQRAAIVAELRFVRSMSVEQVASALGVSERTVELDWAGAKAWLKREMISGTMRTMPE